MVWHLPNVLKNKKTDESGLTLMVKMVNGDGDENDENDNDDDELMRNERIHDAIYGSRVKLKLVMMM